MSNSKFLQISYHHISDSNVNEINKPQNHEAYRFNQRMIFSCTHKGLLSSSIELKPHTNCSIPP